MPAVCRRCVDHVEIPSTGRRLADQLTGGCAVPVWCRVPAGGCLRTGSDAPGRFDQPADDERDAERNQEPGPGLVLEGLAAEAAEEERGRGTGPPGAMII